MDAFEQLVADIFRAKGYWVHQGYKVELSAGQKRALGNPSMPRPEIDLVAYRPGSGELLALECKSYFDSGGVHARDFDPDARGSGRYKMFTRPELREIVLSALVDQLVEAKAVAGSPEPRLGLVFGHATAGNQAQLEEHFAEAGWQLYGPEWVCGQLRAMADQSYDNKVAAMVAKLLLR